MIIVYTDGSFVHRSGTGGWAFRVYRDTEILNQSAGRIQHCTSIVVAEWMAVVKAAQWLQTRTAVNESIEFRVDREEIYTILTASRDTSFSIQARRALDKVRGHLYFQWVPRAENLANDAAIAMRKACDF